MAGGLYVKLDASYEDDEKIIQAGEKAELLYVRSLCLVKRILSDGFVSDSHLPRFGLSGVNQRARTLVKVGLWKRDDERDGYWIVAWLKHNPSREHVEDVKHKRKQAGSKGGKQTAKQSAEQSASAPSEQSAEQTHNPEAEAEAKAEVPVGEADASANGHDPRRCAERWRDYATSLGLQLPPADRLSERFRFVFGVMLDETASEKDLHNQVIGFVSDYIEVACGGEHRLEGGERSFLARCVAEFAPLKVFDAAVEAVTWGAGTGEYADHPKAVVAYMRSVLGKETAS